MHLSYARNILMVVPVAGDPGEVSSRFCYELANSPQIHSFLPTNRQEDWKFCKTMQKKIHVYVYVSIY
jgi:hypothetical protein